MPPHTSDAGTDAGVSGSGNGNQSDGDPKRKAAAADEETCEREAAKAWIRQRLLAQQQDDDGDECSGVSAKPING
jgi:hypothetical protein